MQNKTSSKYEFINSIKCIDINLASHSTAIGRMKRKTAARHENIEWISVHLCQDAAYVPTSANQMIIVQWRIKIFENQRLPCDEWWKSYHHLEFFIITYTKPNTILKFNINSTLSRARQESKITKIYLWWDDGVGTHMHWVYSSSHSVDCRRCSLSKLPAVWSVQLIHHRYSDFPSLLARTYQTSHTHAMQTQQPIWKKGMKLNWFKHKMIGSVLGVDFRHSTRLIWVECALSDRWFGFWWKRKKQQLPIESILISNVVRHIVRKIRFKRVCFSFLISTNFLII